MRARGLDLHSSIRLLAAVVLTLLAATLVACGGDDGGAASSDEDAFVEEGDAICVGAAESYVELTREPVTSPEQGKELDAEVVELREETTARLAELEPPAELESDYDAYLDAEEELTAANRELADAFAQDDREAIDAALGQADGAQEEAEAAAAEVGLAACAGELPEEELAEIGSIAREFVTSTDPAICSELVTEKFLAEVYDGELENCERDVERSEPPSKVTTSDVSGAGPSASLEAQVPDGETLDIALVHEDGEWRVDVINVGA